MKNWKTIAILAVTLSFISFSCSKKTNLGSVTIETHDLDEFNKIRVKSQGQVYLKEGSSYKVEIETHRVLQSKIGLEIVDGELEIKLKLSNRESNSIDDLIYVVTAPSYTSISLDDVGEINGLDKIAGEELIVNMRDVGNINLNEVAVENLWLNVEGVGNIEIAGIATNAYYKMDDVGNIKAFDVETINCEATLSGVGDIELWAEEQLDATITGTGNIYYKGHPAIESDIDGEGKLIDRN